jgi:D-alanyl-D-alanine carboxypeptidase/D-alanyl-D-alanine-endopeptidase (penicillin-binding protein 4)
VWQNSGKFYEVFMLKMILCGSIALGALACAQSPEPIALNPDAYDFRQALAESGIPASQVSFYVQPVNGGEALLAQNANMVQNPASVIKLVTSYVALKTLGADYQWRTDLLSDGTSIYLKGSGDPQLVIEKIEELVQKSNMSGSNLLIDRSIFKDERQDAASFDGEPSMPYNAQPDAALLNFRALSFVFDPATQTVSSKPTLSNYALKNNLQWVEGACPANGWKSTVALSAFGTVASVGGRYYSECGAQQWHVHAYQMSANDYAAGVFSQLLNRKVSVQDGVAPQNAQVVASVLSNPLTAVLKDMNHFSNNVMARQVYLTLSSKNQGSLSASADVVKNVLAQQGLAMNSLVMGNGSGLSNATAVSAADLGAMLVKAAAEPELYDSLPVIGVSGTVKNRLKDSDMVGRGHIKTGTLNDVRAIAGYIDGKSGTRYAVVSSFRKAILAAPRFRSNCLQVIH